MFAYQFCHYSVLSLSFIVHCLSLAWIAFSQINFIGVALEVFKKSTLLCLEQEFSIFQKFEFQNRCFDSTELRFECQNR